MYKITISYKLKDNYVELWHEITAGVQPSFDNEYVINADTQKELEEKFKHFNDNYLDYKRVEDNLVHDPNHNGMANAQAELEKQPRISEIKARLTALSEDIVQDQAGEVVPNIEARKSEFVTLHNELRVLEGKTPRNVEE